MKPSFPLSRKLLVSHFLATFIVSSAIGSFLYLTARESLMDQLRARLSGSAALVSRELDANALRDIRLESDIEKPEYIEALSSLRQMRRANSDIAFLYVMRLGDDGRVYFVVDSDETKSQALPGREYFDGTPELLRGFSEASADRSYTSDEWGTFISGYSPLLNGAGEFLVGIDMRADEVRRKLANLHKAGLIGVLAALILSWLIGSWMSRHFRRPIEAMITQVKAVAAGDLDRRLEMQRQDELDSLLTAINDMTADLKKARDSEKE